MSPVIRQLRDSFLQFPLEDDRKSSTWTFSERIKSLGPNFYSEIMSNHPILNIEYSVLCQQLRNNLSSVTKINKDKFIEQLISALMLAELLEHLHLYYLNVPREVLRLRGHQAIYKQLLHDLEVYNFPSQIPEANAVSVGISLSQQIRETTIHKNWYRLLSVRIKRLLDLIDTFGTNSEGFRSFVSHLDKYTNPILPYLAWCFLLPRLLVNLFLLLKHSIPGNWMSEEEKSLGWAKRFQAQLDRRWFELGNDSVWVAIGLINCFILTGALAPIGMYLTVTFFAYDVVLSAVRAYIELNRLFQLQKDYAARIESETDNEAKSDLIAFQEQLEIRVHFEKIRLGIHVASTTAIFIAMCFAIPAFALNPMIPLIGAIWLVAVSIVGFILSKWLEDYRPKDAIEKPSGVVSLGLFAKPKAERAPKVDEDIEMDVVPVNNL